MNIRLSIQSYLLRIAVVALIFDFAIGTPISVHADSPAEPTLKIGALLSLSGGLEQYGDQLKKGYLLAAEEPSPVKIELKLEDDRSVNKVATVSGAKKLIELDAVDVLLNWTASSTPPLLPIINSAKIPLVIGAYDQTVESGGPFVFGCQVNYQLLVPEVADFMVKKLGLKRIAVISVNDYWSQLYPVRFKKRVEEDGAKVVLQESVDPSATDLKGLILRAQKAGADGIFAPVYSNALYALVKQAKELHFAGPIHGADGIFEEDVQAIGEDAEGIYAVQLWVDNQEFRDRVAKRFGGSSSALQLGMTAGGYDVVRHLREIAEELVKNHQPITKATVLEGIRTHHSTGILGAMFLAQPPASGGEPPIVVHGGRFTLVQ